MAGSTSLGWSLPTALGGPWLQPPLRGAIARAVYVEAALAAGGIWNPTQLEARICDPAPESNGRARERTNKYKGLKEGRYRPIGSTIVEIKDALPNSYPEQWWTHPVFYLLNDAMNAGREKQEALILHALNRLEGPLRLEFFDADSQHGSSSQPDHQAAAAVLPSKRINDVLYSPMAEECAPLERFVLCAALGIRSAVLGEQKLAALCAYRLYNTILDVIVVCPHLTISWPVFCRESYSLFGKLDPAADSKCWPPVSQEQVMHHLAFARRYGGVVLPEYLVPHD